MVAFVLTASGALARPELKTCSANRAYCEYWSKKSGWKEPQCAAAFERCMSSGEWQTTTEFGRSVRNVERR
jgi:hypothetical protein